MDATLVVFILYLILVLIVGILTVRLTRTLSDYLLAGRRLGPWLVAFSERASGESAWLLIGLPGLAFASGYSALWPAIGCTWGIYFSWAVVARRLREQTEALGAITLPAFLERRFDDKTTAIKWIASAIIVFFFTFYVAAQFLAAGKVLNATFGLTPLVGMLIGAVIISFYTIMGGFFAVVWTDLVQGIIMVSALVILPIIGFLHMGGIEGTHGTIAGLGPGFLSAADGATTGEIVRNALGGLAIGLGYVGQPHLVTRYMAIRNPSDIRQGKLIATVWAVAAFYGAVLIGIAGMAMFGGELADKEQVMPLLAQSLLPGWLAGVVIAGAIAAMMSTADSQLLVSTSALTEDVYHNVFAPDAPQGRLVMISRLFTVAVGVVAFFLALTAEEFVYDMVLYAWGGLGAAFGPVLVLSLWWKRMTRAGAIAGLVTGAVTVIVWYNVPVLKGFLYELIPGFVFALAAVVVVSLVTHLRES